jgi:hypothetical protein
MHHIPPSAVGGSHSPSHVLKKASVRERVTEKNYMREWKSFSCLAVCIYGEHAELATGLMRDFAHQSNVITLLECLLHPSRGHSSSFGGVACCDVGIV